MPLINEFWTVAKNDTLRIGDTIAITFERRTTFRLWKPDDVKVRVDHAERIPLESLYRPAEGNGSP